MIETKNGPLYPIWSCYAYNPRIGLEKIAESEMLGNIFNQIGKAIENGATKISLFQKGGEYADGRVPRD